MDPGVVVDPCVSRHCYPRAAPDNRAARRTFRRPAGGYLPPMDTTTPRDGDFEDQDAEPTLNAPDEARPDALDTAGDGGTEDETSDGHPS
jgi:hypothetical protein